MAQDAKPETTEHIVNLRAGVFLAALGVAAILGAAYLAVPITAAGVLLDMGLALLTVALVDLLLVRVVVALASRKSALEEIAHQLRLSEVQANERLAKWEHEFEALKRAVFETTIERIEGKIDAVNTKVDGLFVKLDPSNRETGPGGGGAPLST